MLVPCNLLNFKTDLVQTDGKSYAGCSCGAVNDTLRSVSYCITIPPVHH